MPVSVAAKLLNVYYFPEILFLFVDKEVFFHPNVIFFARDKIIPPKAHETRLETCVLLVEESCTRVNLMNYTNDL